MGAVNLSSSGCCLFSNLHRNLSTGLCGNNTFVGNRGAARGKLILGVKAVNDVVSAAATTDPSEARLTWQIVAGSLAGVVPFVVAGIEFSKRIAEQRKCSVCKGSGLVLRDNKYYFRCPGCGGFLPWQSWRRFFSG